MKAAAINDLITALTKDMDAEEILAADIISGISSAIAGRRIALKLSQGELASRLGKTQSTVSKWENGDVNFTVEALSEIAVKLNMDLTVKLEAKQPVQKHGEYRTCQNKLISFNKVKCSSNYEPEYEWLELKEM